MKNVLLRPILGKAGLKLIGLLLICFALLSPTPSIATLAQNSTNFSGIASSTYYVGPITNGSYSVPHTLSAQDVAGSGYDIEGIVNTAGASIYIRGLNAAGFGSGDNTSVRVGGAGFDYIDIRSNNASFIFDFTSMDLRFTGTGDYTIQALNYNGSNFVPMGSAVTVAAGAANTFSSTGNLSANPDFVGIYGVRIVLTTVPANSSPYFDNIEVTNVRAPTPPPTATTDSASSLAANSATLGGTVSSNGASTTVSFEYGLTTGYGSSVTAAESPLASGASGTSVSAAISGLACNTTYHFRVVGSNSAGTTNGSDNTFTTTACAPTATTGSASSIAANSATLGGTVSSNGASTAVSFEYGLTAAYGSGLIAAAETPLGVAASSASVSKAISSLTCNTTYHFRVVATNSVGTTNGSDNTFTTTACAPTATTGSASSLAATSATLGGTVSSNGASTTVSFEYGLTTAYGSSATAAESPLASGASGASVSAAISGLTCNTTYHFRVKGVNSVGTTNGSDATFTTTACAPTATTGSASSIAATTATLGGTVSSNGASTVVSFEYGPTAAYGSSATAAQSPLASGASGASVSAAITGLSCNTTYHFRVKGVNSVGTSNGSDATFTTSGCVPTTTTGAASSITATSATLAGTITDNGSTTAVSFEYGLTTGYGNSGTASPASVSAGTGSTAITAAISGLTCNTTYHFRINGTNGVGTANGSDASFTTTACVPTATTGTASSITGTGATLGAAVSSNGASTAVTFQYGLTAAYGSSATAAESPLASTASAASVSAAISGLTCNTTYHFRVVGVNTAGTSNGNDATFTSGACPPTVTSISPATGSVLGGTTVVITGTGFTGASTVKFGATDATSVTFNSATQITAVSPAGAAGVVNVTVTTAGGTSATGAANQFTYDAKTYTGPLSGGGRATATITGGGASCGFNTAQFVALSSVPTPPPAGYTFSQGLFQYTLSGCDASTVTVTITYPAAPGAVYWKYGRTQANQSNHWYQLPANFAGNVVSFNISDGGLGDDDLTVNGSIVDPGGPAMLGVSGATAVPTLSEWALLLLSLLVLGAGFSATPGGMSSLRRK